MMMEKGHFDKHQAGCCLDVCLLFWVGNGKMYPPRYVTIEMKLLPILRMFPLFVN